MGWTGTHKPYRMKFRDFLRTELFRDEDKEEMLECSIVRRNTAYMAVRIKKTGEVYGLVVQILFCPNPDVYYNIHYKEVDETMGPYQTACPKKILDLLTPTDNKYAKEWRKACRGEKFSYESCRS